MHISADFSSLKFMNWGSVGRYRDCPSIAYVIDIESTLEFGTYWDTLAHSSTSPAANHLFDLRLPHFFGIYFSLLRVAYVFNNSCKWPNQIQASSGTLTCTCAYLVPYHKASCSSLSLMRQIILSFEGYIDVSGSAYT